MLGKKLKSRPIIRWAGSKTRILPILVERMPEKYERYIEPFCGSMSLFVKLNPERSIMGDINPDLINFYGQLKEHHSEIAIRVLSLARTKEEYYRLRALDHSLMTPLDRAVRFFYLNRHCFNGVYRTNLKGHFNVPFGSKLTEIPSAKELALFSDKIRGTEFLNCDFETTVARAGEGDLVYLDPPYAGTETKDRGEYGPNSFKTFDIQRLGMCLRQASDRGAKILLSYASINAIREEFNEWKIHEIYVERSVSGFARGRKKVPEVIITNY
ncbi:Dam family site-specific DNA-(adenine-N6)-methyltransferase [Pseudomonas putida]|uniref:DNA adenine methylase n=1 Tax=Pseudomonas putida TaxID=303 RepID=UPI002D1EC886|nr:Dam family site-specific DNA-(adenine-N6)-methyltransferase [Pseudomonas putida]MEB3901163.1 Dam family site-specific DNA-(adenine-N6)-methyltransferase [Pseudomonas putida]